MTNVAKKRLIRKLVAAEADAATRLSDAIADLAEPGMEEHESAALLAAYLTERGFTVEFPFRRMPTAFRAVAGRGRPTIGMLAEYDALPDCGPTEGTWGHGCGHNLLGAAAAVGAVAAKGALDARDLRGRVVVWGTPAEETLIGKVYMARDGAFAGDDAVLGWHPGSSTRVGRLGGSAMDSMLFEYHGRTAHAGAAPHKGRSALDGVMLLDVAANYLREHVPSTVRIHMCIRDGGDAPNVVPAYAKAWYYVRGKTRDEVDDVRTRLIAAARGAAMATGTKVKVTRLTGVYHRLVNDIMGDTVAANLKLFGPPPVTPADKRRVRAQGLKAVFDTGITNDLDAVGTGSSDEDNVSWLAPFGRFNMVCVSEEGVTGHHRSLANQVKLPFAHRGMMRAAEVLAGCAVDLIADRENLAAAKAEFRKRTRGFTYDPLIGKRQTPPSVNP